MAWRVTSFLLCQFAGGALGWFAAGEPGALAGGVAGGLTWFVLDLSRGLRVLRWLRQGARNDHPRMLGLWGEVGERMRRALRSSEQLAGDAEGRLQEFLAAIQASPNGVVLLD